MNIVETPEELTDLISLVESNDSIWYFMWVDYDKHPLNNELSFICVYVNSDLYIIGVNHVDLLCFSLEDLSELFNTSSDKYIFQKKKVLHSVIFSGNVYDIDSYHYLNSLETIDYESYFEGYISRMYSRGVYTEQIRSIPIVRLSNSVQELIDTYGEVDKSIFGYEWFNGKFIPTLNKLERHGLTVDVEKFSDRFDNHQLKHIKNGKVYTEYNPFTATGRPSNRHGGINYAGLDKKDGTREIFHSGDSVFVHFDFDAYHPRIIGELIDYDLPDTSVHQWLADIYGVGYDESKGITFKNLYGGIMDEYKDHPFFKQADEFIQGHWEQVQEDGYIETFHRKILMSWVENVNPQKAFNYLLQAIETEKNVDKMDKIFSIIEDSDIYLILYTYDSFLFQVPMDVDKDKIREIYKVLTEDGYPISYSYGTNYNQL